MSNQSHRPNRRTRIALVNMPFAMADRPSIQCGLLKTALVRAGFEADVHYLNLEFAAQFGARFHHELSILRADLLLGDWLFSVSAFGYRPNEEEYRQACPAILDACQSLGADFERLCELRNRLIPEWILSWTEKLDWSRYLAVGFTSSYQQSTAALAMARAIKLAHPAVVTIFGGPNFDGTMGREYVRALDFIDYAVVGEGDTILPEMISRLEAGTSPLVTGVVGRQAEHQLVDTGPALMIRDLDTVGDPDYDEYFETLSKLGRERALGPMTPVLPFETARGCWWGEKQHCTFCGLNDGTIKFRSKSPEQAVGLLQRLASRYQLTNFVAVDNILDYRYLEQVCGPLSEQRYDYRIFYETKANLTAAQLRTMSRAGIRYLQPGIESLNSHVLSLMRKGITMLRNVRFLKWAHYYGMRITWNILTGFPGELREDYREQLGTLAQVRHLPPPNGNARIWLERFSPYFFDPTFPVRDRRPLPAYSCVYPGELLNLEEIAYFFEHEMDSVVPDEEHEDLSRLVQDWRAAWKRSPRPELVFQRAPDWIHVFDRRRNEGIAAHAFEGEEAEIYQYCSETDRTPEGIAQHLQEHGRDLGDGAVPAALQKFCDLGLMLQEKNRYLSLALPLNRHW